VECLLYFKVESLLYFKVECLLYFKMDDVQERREIRRQLSRSPGNTVNILASELRNALTREQTEAVPDIIGKIFDY
jgi:hypothetical protein